jgi:hypothetical protein
VNAKQLADLYVKYQQDMDFYSTPKSRRTQDNFGRWMWGNLTMPQSERYIPEDEFVWRDFVNSVKWGEDK